MENLRKEVSEIAESLHEKHDLSEFEALQIAVKIQQNRVLSESFGITKMDKYPAFLEAISMAIRDMDISPS